MSELQPNFQRLKVVGRQQPDPKCLVKLGSLAERARESGAPLVLRQLSRSGEFVRTITCKPGHVSILESSDPTSFKPFQETLSGRQGVDIVSLRYGARELFPSEVYSLGNENTGWERLTVVEALTSAGAAVRLIAPTLAFVGLEGVASTQVISLDDCAMRRLALCCALFSRCPVVFMDRPFETLTSAWTERLAALLAESAKSSNKIFIVTGVDRLPAAWKKSDTVKVEQIGTWRKRALSFRAGADPLLSESIDKARLMMGVARFSEQKAQNDCFVTRAQSIHRPVVKCQLPERVQTEAIVNAAASVEMQNDLQTGSIAVSGLYHRDSVESPAAEEGITRLRKKTGKLTRVSKIERLLAGTLLYRHFRRARAWSERVWPEPLLFLVGLYLIQLFVP